MQHTEHLVIVTGVNNLVTWFQNTGENDLFAPLFGEHVIKRLAELPLASLAALADDPLHAVTSWGLLRALMGRISCRTQSSELKKPMGIASKPSGPTRAQLANAAERALAQQTRDIEMLIRAGSPSMTTLLAAQPFLPTAGGKRSEEELELCELWDGLERDREQWNLLKAWLTETWPQYVSRLAGVAEQMGVEFVDLNALPYRGWSFVDHVHLTDHGYQQAAVAIAEMIG